MPRPTTNQRALSSPRAFLAVASWALLYGMPLTSPPEAASLLAEKRVPRGLSAVARAANLRLLELRVAFHRGTAQPLKAVERLVEGLDLTRISVDVLGLPGRPGWRDKYAKLERLGRKANRALVEIDAVLAPCRHVLEALGTEMVKMPAEVREKMRGEDRELTSRLEKVRVKAIAIGDGVGSSMSLVEKKRKAWANRGDARKKLDAVGAIARPTIASLESKTQHLALLFAKDHRVKDSSSKAAAWDAHDLATLPEGELDGLIAVLNDIGPALKLRTGRSSRKLPEEARALVEKVAHALGRFARAYQEALVRGLDVADGKLHAGSRSPNNAKAIRRLKYVLEQAFYAVEEIPYTSKSNEQPFEPHPKFVPESVRKAIADYRSHDLSALGTLADAMEPGELSSMATLDTPYRQVNERKSTVAK